MLDSRPYHPNRLKLTQLMLAGAVAGSAMTVLGYLPRAFEFPAMDYGALYGAALYSRQLPPIGSSPWLLGLAFHVFDTIVIIPVIYDYLIERRILPNVATVKGWLFGGLIWFVIEALTRPLFGEGLFARSMPAPLLQVLLNLVCCLVYGSVLESVLRLRMVHRLRTIERHAA